MLRFAIKLLLSLLAILLATQSVLDC